MNRILVILLLMADVFFSALAQQPDSLRFYEEKMGEVLAFFRKQISEGKYLKMYSSCGVASHNQYDFGNGQIALYASFAGYEKEKQEHFIQYKILKLKGAVCQNSGDLQQAEVYWNKALAICTENGFVAEEIHDLRKGLNNIYFLNGKLAEAYKNSLDGLATSVRVQDKVLEAHFSNVLGFIQMKLKNFPVARKYFDQYLAISTSLRDYSLEGHAYYNKADLAMEMNLPDSALYFLQHSEKAYRKSVSHPGYTLFDIEERNAYLSHKKAEVHKRKNLLSDARLHIQVALQVVDWPFKVNMYDKADYLISAGDIYNRLNIPDTALIYLKKGLWFALESQHREHIQKAYGQMAISFSLKKNFDSAWIYNTRFMKLKDSLDLAKSSLEIEQREAVFQLEKKEKEFTEKLKSQRMLQYGIIGFSVLSLLILLLLYNRYKLKQENLMQQQLNQQQDEILKNTIRVQDEERKRIAEDLHDSLGSLLSAAKLKLSAINGDVATEGRLNEDLVSGIHILDEAMSEMKNIAYNIMPVSLSRFGLITALQHLFNRISSRTNLKVEYHHHGFENRMEEFTEISLYRIVLESVNNILKHANATTVSVQLVKHPEYISLVIEDNGTGFITGEKMTEGNGLQNIRSRVLKLNGHLDIDSRPGTGTTILAEIPSSG